MVRPPHRIHLTSVTLKNLAQARCERQENRYHKGTKSVQTDLVPFVASLAGAGHSEDAIEEGCNGGVNFQLIRVALEVMRVVRYH